MTDKPEVVATADLTPQSPKPINLSSTAAVPALQDQADSLSIMALSPSEDVFTDILHLAQVSNGHANVQEQNESADITTIVDAVSSDANPSSESVVQTSQAVEVQDHPTETYDDIEDEYARDFDSPTSSADNAVQDGGDSSAATSDAVKTETSQPGPSHTDSVTSLSQSTLVPISGTDSQTATNDPQPTFSAHVTLNVAEDNAVPESPVVPQPAFQDAIDIQALVDNITARHAASESVDNLPLEANEAGANATTNAQSSLPPKPPTSQQSTTAVLRPEELHSFQSIVPTNVPNLTPAASFPYSFPPGTAPATYVPPNPYANAGPPMPIANPYNGAATSDISSQSNSSQRYDDFLKEERKYVSEAKWDRFPEGSRLFIGQSVKFPPFPTPTDLVFRKPFQRASFEKGSL